jgi:hypothetical protein
MVERDVIDHGVIAPGLLRRPNVTAISCMRAVATRTVRAFLQGIQYIPTPATARAHSNPEMAPNS